jgi:hypothetical protein
MGKWPEQIEYKEIEQKKIIKNSIYDNNAHQKEYYLKECLKKANNDLEKVIPWLPLSFWEVKNKIDNDSDQYGLYYIKNFEKIWLGDIYAKNYPWNDLNTKSIRKFLKDNYVAFKANKWVEIDIPWIAHWLYDNERKNKSKNQAEWNILSLLDQIKSTDDNMFIEITKDVIEDRLGENVKIFIWEWNNKTLISLDGLVKKISELPIDKKLKKLNLLFGFSWEFSTDTDKQRKIYKVDVLEINL